MVSLGEVLDGKTGYVAISSPDMPRPPLAGDFVRVDLPAAKSGQLLVSTDTSRIPPELCREWSVRFLNGEPLGTSTAFFFFVPGNGGNTSKEVVTGKVYTEAGHFVQEISVDAAEEAFQRTTQDIFNGLPLLAGSGSIEWTFREGLVGHLTTIHKLKGKDEVAVPGFCRTPQSEGLSSLILPYFQVDSDPNGATTYLALRNETDEELPVRIKFFNHEGTLACNQPEPQDRHLAGRETYTVNLRTAGIPDGYATAEVVPPDDDPPLPTPLNRALSGDYIFVNGNGSLAGSALVDADLKRSPNQLCQKWDTRFVKGKPWNTDTSFVFYYIPPAPPANDSPVATGKIYDEKGMQVLPDITVPLSPAVSFLEPWTRDGSGAIEWSFPVGTCGYIATLFTGTSPEGKNYSFLIPGVCRAPCPTEPGD
jgi:hypothetical protein